MGRNRKSTRTPQASKRSRQAPIIGLVTPWHEAGIDTLNAYSRTVSKDREVWR